MRALPSWHYLNIIISQRPYLLISLYWELGLQPLNIHLVHNKGNEGISVKPVNHNRYTKENFQRSRSKMSFLVVVVQSLNPVWLFVTPWAVAHQAPVSVGFLRQEYWSWLPFLSPGDLPDPGIDPCLLYWQVDYLSQSHLGSPKCSFTVCYRMLKLPHNSLISYASKVMLKILQARLQQYVNRELPDVQASFRKGRGPRGQIANICWIIEKAREFQKSIYFCIIGYVKAFDCVDQNKSK